MGRSPSDNYVWWSRVGAWFHVARLGGDVDASLPEGILAAPAIAGVALPHRPPWQQTRALLVGWRAGAVAYSSQFPGHALTPRVLIYGGSATTIRKRSKQGLSHPASRHHRHPLAERIG